MHCVLEHVCIVFCNMWVHCVLEHVGAFCFGTCFFFFKHVCTVSWNMCAFCFGTCVHYAGVKILGALWIERTEPHKNKEVVKRTL